MHRLSLFLKNYALYMCFFRSDCRIMVKLLNGRRIIIGGLAIVKEYWYKFTVLCAVGITYVYSIDKGTLASSYHAPYGVMNLTVYVLININAVQNIPYFIFRFLNDRGRNALIANLCN